MLSKKEKEILSLALDLLSKHYDEQEETCRKFKWICHNHLPQHGEGYEKNKNVFEIQDKTIADLRKQKDESRKVIMDLIRK